MARRDELLVEIAREESRLAALNAEVEESSARLAALRNEFAAEPSVQIVIPPKLDSVIVTAPMTNAAKVALFRSLFRGRDDVFPRRWENAKLDQMIEEAIIDADGESEQMTGFYTMLDDTSWCPFRP